MMRFSRTIVLPHLLEDGNGAGRDAVRMDERKIVPENGTVGWEMPPLNGDQPLGEGSLRLRASSLQESLFADWPPSVFQSHEEIRPRALD